MNRRVLLLAVLAVAAHWQAVYAQTIVVPELTPLGKFVPVEIHGLADGERFLLMPPAGGDARNIGLNRGLATGVTGSHVLTAVIVPKEGELRTISAPFAVGDSPGPTPPPVKTLKDMAGTDADAIAVQLAALGRVLKPADAPYFQAALASSLERFKASPAHPAILKRLKTLTDHASIVAELGRVVAELGGAPPPPPPTPGPTTPAVTAAVYVYEKDQTAVPNGVRVGLDRLNRERKIRATAFEDDILDGTDDVPDQYKAPLVAAREAGLPALVVMAGDVVLKVVSNPTTEGEVWGACP